MLLDIFGGFICGVTSSRESGREFEGGSADARWWREGEGGAGVSTQGWAQDHIGGWVVGGRGRGGDGMDAGGGGAPVIAAMQGAVPPPQKKSGERPPGLVGVRKG